MGATWCDQCSLTGPFVALDSDDWPYTPLYCFFVAWHVLVSHVLARCSLLVSAPQMPPCFAIPSAISTAEFSTHRGANLEGSLSCWALGEPIPRDLFDTPSFRKVIFEYV